MFTISRSAAALVALALTASVMPANAGMYTSSCVGGWRYGSCVETFVAEPRHPNLRYVPWAWGDEMSDAEHKAMAARDRKWVARGRRLHRGSATGSGNMPPARCSS